MRLQCGPQAAAQASTSAPARAPAGLRVGSSSSTLLSSVLRSSGAPAGQRRALSQTHATGTVQAGTAKQGGTGFLASLPVVGSTVRKGGSAVPVVVYGAQGLTGIALVKSFLEAGQKVVAVVELMEAALETLEFAKKYELLDKQALSNLQLKEVTPGEPSGLPRGAQFVIVEGDSIANTRTDARYVQAGLATAQAAGAAKVVLVTSESGKSGTFFSFFGGGIDKPNKNLTNLEQLAQACGVPATIIRASTLEEVGEEAEGVRVAPGPGVLAPGSAAIGKGQLAEVLRGVLGAPAPPPGAAMVVEVAAGAGGAPLSAVLEDALEDARAKTPVAIKGASVPKGTTSLGTVSLRKTAPRVPEKKAAKEEGTTKGTGTARAGTASFFGGLLGTGSKAVNADGDDDEETAPAKKAAPARKPAPKPVAKAPPPPPPAKKLAPPPPKRAPARASDGDDEDEAPAKKGGLFGFLAPKPKPAKEDQGTSKVAAKRAPPPPPPKKVPPPPKKVLPPPKARASARGGDDDDEDEAPKKKGGLFGFLAPKPKPAASSGTTSTSRGTVRVGGTQKARFTPVGTTASKQAPKAKPPPPKPAPKAPPPKPAAKAPPPKPSAKPSGGAVRGSSGGQKGTFKPISGYRVTPKK